MRCVLVLIALLNTACLKNRPILHALHDHKETPVVIHVHCDCTKEKK